MRLLSLCTSLLLTSSLLVSCAQRTPETSFYLLESKPIPTGNLTLPSSHEEHTITFQIRNLEVPRYLDSSNAIVTRNGVEMTPAEYYSWGENITDGIRRVMTAGLIPALAENTILLISSDKISMYALDVRFSHFEGALGEDVRLDVSWNLNKKGEGAISAASFQTKRPAGDTYKSLVEAHGLLLQDMLNMLIPSVLSAIADQK